MLAREPIARLAMRVLDPNEPRRLTRAIAEIEAAWTDEARRRVAEVDAGQVATLSNEEALRIIASDD